MSLDIYAISKKNKISETRSQPALSIYVTLGKFFLTARSKVHPKVCNSEDKICKKFRFLP